MYYLCNSFILYTLLNLSIISNVSLIWSYLIIWLFKNYFFFLKLTSYVTSISRIRSCYTKYWWWSNFYCIFWSSWYSVDVYHCSRHWQIFIRNCYSVIQQSFTNGFMDFQHLQFSAKLYQNQQWWWRFDWFEVRIIFLLIYCTKLFLVVDRPLNNT